MEPMHADVLIVGAGHAGVATAAALVKGGYPGSVLMIGRESGLPYERPPLSKTQLYGVTDVEPTPLRSADYWARSPVTLRRGEQVISVDVRARTVSTDLGQTVEYGHLVWAAGGRAAAVALPGAELDGVHSIREHADVAALRSGLARTSSIAVIGGGYIGLEAAAAMRALGRDVALFEAGSRLLGRVTGPVISDFFAQLHRAHGVDVRLNTAPIAFVGRDNRLSAVRLADGSLVRADAAVVGVGMRPNVRQLLAAGVAGDEHGVDVDARCRTSLPDIFAIGDCARTRSAWSVAAAPMRIESVHNAHQHASVVADVLLGRESVLLAAPPRFWSTQYGSELKTVGLAADEDRQLVRGDPATGSFSVVYLRHGVVAAIDTINRARDYARAQALIAARWRPDDVATLVDDLELPRLSAARVAGEL